LARRGNALSQLFEFTELAPFADLHGALNAAREARSADRWTAEEIHR